MAQPAYMDDIMSGIANTGAVKKNNHRQRLSERFVMIKKLGQGTFGKVQLAIDLENGQQVAIKSIKKRKIGSYVSLIRKRREMQIMNSVQHPNIIQVYEIFENRQKLVLVMEFASGGELFNYLSERKVLAEVEARRIFRQISAAVYYCHKNKICHRDLKLENILLDERGNAKIIDFGLSSVFDDQRLLATFCGSNLYASPEIVKETPYRGPEVDCWSLGVLLYALVYGGMPFGGSNLKGLVRQITTGDYYEPKSWRSSASPLIKEMLTVCPRSRATIEKICNHWWINTGYTKSCLVLAQQLANKCPVRLETLLSLKQSAASSDRGHSVHEMGNNGAEGEGAHFHMSISEKIEVHPNPVHLESEVEARRARSNQAKTKSNIELDQLCDQTKNVALSEDNLNDRQEKLKSARKLLGNVVRVGRMCMGVREPPVPCTSRSVSGSVTPSSTVASIRERNSVRFQTGANSTNMRLATMSVSNPERRMSDQKPFEDVSSKPIIVGSLTKTPARNIAKTSRAEIVPATLPQRKTAKREFN